jgi:hypothetical protein
MVSGIKGVSVGEGLHGKVSDHECDENIQRIQGWGSGKG